MKKEIQELTLAIAGIDQQLLLVELKDLKRNLSIELQASRDDRRAQKKEFREFMSELWGILRKIQAQFRIDATLLNLIEPQREPDKGPPDDEEKDINQKLTDWH